MKLSPASTLTLSFILIVTAVAHALFISIEQEGNLPKYLILVILFAGVVILLRRAWIGWSQQHAAEIKFKALLDAAPDATVIVGEKGTIEMVNRQTENIFGYTRSELIGQPVEILMPPELRHGHLGHRESFMRNPKTRAMGVGMELNAVNKQGVAFPVEISLSPITVKNDRLVSAAIRDITHRKNLENELKRSNAEMEAFTYSVSHDLRAPLRGIIGFTAMLEEDYASKLDDEAKRITGVIRNNASNMGRLIDDLLSFSRMGRKDIVKMHVDMNMLVKEVIREVVPPQRLEAIHWNLTELHSVTGDQATLRQVWVNLLSNAVKYSAKTAEPEISIGSFMKQGQHVFFVKDNGVGFDENYKNKLFKVFQRLHGTEEFEGTGVGLALVDKIIAKHGGSVWATGQENKGATFYFSIP